MSITKAMIVIMDKPDLFGDIPIPIEVWDTICGRYELRLIFIDQHTRDLKRINYATLQEAIDDNPQYDYVFLSHGEVANNKEFVHTPNMCYVIGSNEFGLQHDLTSKNILSYGLTELWNIEVLIRLTMEL